MYVCMYVCMYACIFQYPNLVCIARMIFPLPAVSSTMYNAPGSVPVSRRRSGTPGGASIDDSILANMIFDNAPKSSSPGGMGGVNNNSSAGLGGGGSGTNLQKSPHHKSTSALSDVQTNNSSATSGKRGSTTNAPYSGSSSAHSGRAHTLAVTDSPSYLSSIGGGTYADDYEGASPPSSGFSSANTSFTSSNYGGNHSNVHGSHHGITSGGSGFRGDFDLGDDILQHFAGGGSGGNSHSSSPTGYSAISHGSGGSSSGHHHRSDVASGSPVTHYKRASSPILTFPTDSQKGYLAGHGERAGRGGGGGVGSGSGKHAHHHHQQHYPHVKDINRSRSPDLQHHHLMSGYSSSYHAPSILDHQPNNAAAVAYRHHSSTHQHPTGGTTRTGGVSPTMYVQGQMGGPSSAGGRGDLQCHKAGGWVEDRKSPVQRHATISSEYSHHYHQQQQQQQQQQQHHHHGNKSGGQQVRNPNSHTSSTLGGGKDSSSNPYRGTRKASDQEMGIMEALTMMDKRSTNSSNNKFDDGTLV